MTKASWWGASYVAYTTYFRSARDDMDHSVLSRMRGRSGSYGLIAGILIKEAFGFIGEELPEVSLFQ
ncbi:hypothetical protein DY000_02053312 [Brassica cretica]|uniref:Uncharacterized protein n=1 Tax=Brassica cretica TaxID=69181 RepID=A0ABQ7A9A9_BRACR|nr:hypothetical protein DY000_02053312 [Brassica cretica]